jgi:hypothetical protein
MEVEHAAVCEVPLNYQRLKANSLYGVRVKVGVQKMGFYQSSWKALASGFCQSAG